MGRLPIATRKVESKRFAGTDPKIRGDRPRENFIFAAVLTRFAKVSADYGGCAVVRHFRAAWILARTQFTTARFPTFREKWEAVLRPPVGDISILDFHKADKLVEIGYEYTITEWQRFIGAADDYTVFI